MGRALSSGELSALLAVCAADRRPAGVRDAALIATLYSALVRRSEVEAFLREDYDAEPGPLFAPLTKSGKATLRQHRPQAVAEALARRAEEAAVAASTA